MDAAPPDSALNTSVSSATFHKVTVTPSKAKTPSYQRSAPIKILTHPIDKNIAWSFLLSVIFVSIAIVSGLPVVTVLSIILPVSFMIRRLCSGCCRTSCTTRYSSEEDLESGDSSVPCCCPSNLVTALDAFWLYDSPFNLYVAHCLFFLDTGLSTSKLRDLMRMRVINKTTEYGYRAFPRLIQKVIPVCCGYCWVEDEDFSIDKHIYEEPVCIRSRKELEDHVSSLMAQPMAKDRPLWEIRVITKFGQSQDTVLVVRIHHAISDAVSLVKILGNYLSDNEQLVRLKPRFGGTTYLLSVFRALIVGPLIFLGWVFFTRRDYNYFNRRQKPQSRVVAWSKDIRFNKVNRIKQVMRCCLNDVIVSSVTGAVRSYFRKKGIRNPPNVTLSVPVDLRYETLSGAEIPDMGTQYAHVNVRLPSNTEGSIPRLWDVRHRMEEMKTSADPAVMYGATHFLISLLPEIIAHWLLRTVLRKATVVIANVPGPEETLSLGSKRLKKMTFWMATNPEVPLAFSVISYAGTIQLAVSSDSAVVPKPRELVDEFMTELRRLSYLLARRRIPGEHRRRSNFTAERRQEEIIKPPVQELQHKLYSVQTEIHDLTQRLSELQNQATGPPTDAVYTSEMTLAHRLDELKEEFSELMSELRRRKSLADGIIVSTEEEDMDGELRRSRRRTFSGTGRRASLTTVLSTLSTARPLTTPSISHHTFVASTPNLDAAGSPTSSQQTTSFLQVAQERFGRRKSDFN